MRNSRTAFTSETELARKVVDWLQDQHWEVYQEVDMGAIADIVAVQGRLTWVIECKLSMGLAVMEQASNWIGEAHYVSVAVPYSRHNSFCEKVLRWLGVGILRVSSTETYRDCPVIKEELSPRLWRNIKGNLRKGLCDAQKSYAEAGNNKGRRWSPFKQTCQDVLDYVKRHPGCGMKEMLTNVQTHYRTTSTARNCIKTWAEAGRIPGIRMVKEDGRLRFYTTEAS